MAVRRPSARDSHSVPRSAANRVQAPVNRNAAPETEPVNPEVPATVDLPGGRGEVEVLLVPGPGRHPDRDRHDLHHRRLPEAVSSRARSRPTATDGPLIVKTRTPSASA